MVYIILFLLSIFFFAVFLDIFYTSMLWQSRIHIGRFANRHIWHEQVLKRSIKWLTNTPTIPLTDNKRLIIIDILRGNYKRSAIQSWQEASLFLGLDQYVKTTGNPKIQKMLEEFIRSKTDSASRWKSKPTDSDHVMLAYAILSAEFVDPLKYRPAFDETYHLILSLKGSDGTVAYKNHNRDYRFVDTIGFICPFLVTYGLKFNIPDAIDLGVHQILEYQKYGMMAGENIPCHTYLTNSKIPAGLCGWGRGLAWFALGLIDSWNALPGGHPHKMTLVNLVVKTARSALKFQRQNGGFNWLLFVKESRLDSSTTAAMCWFFALASQIPEISSECNSAKEAGLKYLQSVTRRNGAVDFSQGDTKGIGVYSQNFDILPFTQGLLLRILNYKADSQSHS